MSHDYRHLEDSDGRVLQARWSAEHDLIHELVPFRHNARDPWDQLADLRAWLQDLPETVATWDWGECPAFTRSGGKYQALRQVLCDVVGAWRFRESSSRPNLWVNPTYPQLAATGWHPVEDRLLHLLRNGMLGKWTLTELVNRYGIVVNNMPTWLRRRGFKWEKIVSYGRRRIANTAQVAYSWTTRTQGDIAQLLGVPKDTLRSWVRREGTLETIPQRPCHNGIAARW